MTLSRERSEDCAAVAANLHACGVGVTLTPGRRNLHVGGEEVQLVGGRVKVTWTLYVLLEKDWCGPNLHQNMFLHPSAIAAHDQLDAMPTLLQLLRRLPPLYQYDGFGGESKLSVV